ncbi:uncharacterized protein LOC134543241 [Bacillus rossius redtenbacheri]|uniref:uncharacterized protein LOC134543241 n=1 Tax=Bacillus rossius redtenbacheri TaxID=93214 RepID=UPI002FDE9993
MAVRGVDRPRTVDVTAQLRRGGVWTRCLETYRPRAVDVTAQLSVGEVWTPSTWARRPGDSDERLGGELKAGASTHINCRRRGVAGLVRGGTTAAQYRWMIHTMSPAGKAMWLLAAVAACVLGYSQGQQPVVVDDLCLGCICEAVSNCNRTVTCTGDVCGLFRITWAYWADSGKPVLANDHPDSPDAYVRCVTDPFCAATAVRGYMAKFAKDCNGDGAVSCFDFAAIHRLGGYGCSGALDYNYQNRFLQCQAQVAQLSNGK